MAENNNCTNVKILDPVQGLVDYVNDVKPYHTKVIEVLTEYVYGEDVVVTIEEDPAWHIELAYPQEDFLGLSCFYGYSTLPYGGGELWPIISPNQGILFQDYPAINPGTRTVTIPGNRAGDFPPGTQIEIITFVENHLNLYQIVTTTPGPAGTGSFEILDPFNTFTTYFESTDDVGYPTPGKSATFQTTGTVSDDGRTFHIRDTIDHDAGTGITTVKVHQAILSSLAIVSASCGFGYSGYDETSYDFDECTFVPGSGSSGRLGIVVVPGNNTGMYTVTQSLNSPGFIDSWPGVPNVALYKLGDEPHTVITVAELLNIPVFNYPNEVYVAFIRIKPIEIEKVLSYSDFTTEYDPIAPDYTQTPDEGFRREDVIDVVVSTLDGFGAAIPDTGKFVVAGDFEVSNLFVGDKLRISTSTGNNGTYTITSIVYDDLLDQTTFGTVEYVRNSTPDGVLEVDIPSNVFIVDGNLSARFFQGKQFRVSGGTFAGTYTTLSSDFVDDKTRIRPAQEIIDPGTGISIVDVTAGFVIRGDFTSQFTSGTKFNVVGSPSNDDGYTVDTSTYIGYVGSPPQLIHQTIIVPNETIEPEVGGEIHLVELGTIKEHHLFGYSEHSDVCSMSPEGIVNITFFEQLTFEGLGIELHDDVIAYNLENTDTSSYELPADTAVSATEPTILEQASPPPVPAINDFWFNTSVAGPPPHAPQTLHRWNGNKWKAITTAYWLDTNTMLLYYRTKTKFVDTGSTWILVFAAPPGFNDIQPSLGETVILGRENFTVDEVGGGVPEATFEFKTLTKSITDLEQETPSTEGFFIVDGNLFTEARGMNLNVGQRTLEVTGSTGNDGTYTITNVSYHSIDDETQITVAESIPSPSTTGSIVLGPLTVAGGDKELIKVTLNGVPLDFTLDSPTQFTLINVPVWEIGDEIVAVVYQRSRVETNANVNEYDLEPHQVYHRGTDVFPGDLAYVLYGGNYVNRFITENRFNVYSFIGSPMGLLATQQAESFPIVDVDDEMSTISIEGNWEWLFGNPTGSPLRGRIFSVRTSENNLHDFEAVSSTYVPSIGRTIIGVQQPNVYESPAETSTDPIQYFYNPGIVVLNVDEVTDTIVVGGNVVNEFPSGTRVRLLNSTTGNYNAGDGEGILTVSTSTYDSFNDRTNVGIVENLPDPDSSGNARLHSPIYQNYSRDLGVILGAVYDPVVLGTSQVKTYVVPSTPVESDTDALTYTWAGPLRMEIGLFPTTNVTNTITDRIGASDQLLSVPDRYIIIATDATANTITVHYDDPVLSIPVDLTDSFTPGTILTIAGSYGEGIAASSETNDAVYVVKSVVWDGGGTGDTIIEIEDVFDNVPPYTSLTVNSISNNLGGGNPEIVFAGDVTAILQPPGLPIGVTPTFYLDQPIVSTTPLLNAITITDVSFAAGETTVTVDRDFIDEAFTGIVGIISEQYRADIAYDSTNTTPPWIHGYIIREALRIDQFPEGVTSTTFDENLDFGWGTTWTWPIIGTDEPNSTIYIDGDITSALDPNDRGEITGSDGNDSDYEVDSFTYNVGMNRTEIVLKFPEIAVDPTGSPPRFGSFRLDDIDITNWYQYLIREAKPARGSPPVPVEVFEVYGNATGDVQSGQQFRVMGTTNNGLYTSTAAPTYDPGENTTDIPVASIPNNEKGGWVESYRDQGIRIVFEDHIGVSVGEDAVGAVLVTGGNIMDAWDYNYWSVGAFDENLGQVIHLYSNSFT